MRALSLGAFSWAPRALNAPSSPPRDAVATARVRAVAAYHVKMSLMRSIRVVPFSRFESILDKLHPDTRSFANRGAWPPVASRDRTRSSRDRRVRGIKRSYKSRG